MNEKIYVVKASGDKELFNKFKIISSLVRAGTPIDIAEEVADEVEEKVYNGISTREIYNICLKILIKKYPRFAAKYDLKRSIMILGPSGFPFEKFFANILREYGYDVENNLIFKGKCVEHEIDVFAKKNGKRIMIECKHHSEPGIYVDLKVVLYTYARFLDLSSYFNEVWVVSNTRFSKEAVRYGKCMNVKLIGWRYPKDMSLEKMIEDKKLYPITILKSVKYDVIKRLVEKNIILVRDLRDKSIEEISIETGLSYRIVEKILNEAIAILKI